MYSWAKKDCICISFPFVTLSSILHRKFAISTTVHWMLMQTEPCFVLHTNSKATSISTAKYWMLGQSTGVRFYSHIPCFPFFPLCSTASRNGLCINTACILHQKPFNLRCVLCLTSAIGCSWGNWTCITIMKTCGIIIEQMNPWVKTSVLYD